MKEKKQSERKRLSVLLVLAQVIGLVSGMSVMAYADIALVACKTTTVDGTTHAVTFINRQCTNHTVAPPTPLHLQMAIGGDVRIKTDEDDEEYEGYTISNSVVQGAM